MVKEVENGVIAERSNCDEVMRMKKKMMSQMLVLKKLEISIVGIWREWEGVVALKDGG